MLVSACLVVTVLALHKHAKRSSGPAHKLTLLLMSCTPTYLHPLLFFFSFYCSLQHSECTHSVAENPGMWHLPGYNILPEKKLWVPITKYSLPKSLTLGWKHRAPDTASLLDRNKSLYWVLHWWNAKRCLEVDSDRVAPCVLILQLDGSELFANMPARSNKCVYFQPL